MTTALSINFMETTQKIFKPRKLGFWERIYYDMAVKALALYLNDQMEPGHEHVEKSREYCQQSHKTGVITLEYDNHKLTWEDGTVVPVTKDVLVTNFNRMPDNGITKLVLHLTKDDHKVSYNDDKEHYAIKTILMM